MEFIIIGLFILFFSYILLYSLYDRFFKSSDNILEGLTAEGDTTSSSPTSSPTSSPSSSKTSKSKSSSASASASASKSAEATAENASNQSDSANSQIQAHNAKRPNMTFSNASINNAKPI